MSAENEETGMCLYALLPGHETDGLLCHLKAGHRGPHCYGPTESVARIARGPEAEEPAHVVGDPDRLSWPDWLSDDNIAGLRTLEHTAQLASVYPSGSERLRAAGHRARATLREISRTSSTLRQPPVLPWPPGLSPDSLGALAEIEAVAVICAVEGDGGEVLAELRQLRQNLADLTSAYEDLRDGDGDDDAAQEVAS